MSGEGQNDTEMTQAISEMKKFNASRKIKKTAYMVIAANRLKKLVGGSKSVI